MKRMSSLRRKGITNLVSAGSMVLLLIGLLMCPLMLTGIGQANTACAETDGSHEPMSDARMSCCSPSAQSVLLTPTDAFSSRVLKNWASALLNTEPTLTHPRALAVRYDASVPITTNDPPLFLQNASFLI